MWQQFLLFLREIKLRLSSMDHKPSTMAVSEQWLFRHMIEEGKRQEK